MALFEALEEDRVLKEVMRCRAGGNQGGYAADAEGLL